MAMGDAIGKPYSMAVMFAPPESTYRFFTAHCVFQDLFEQYTMQEICCAYCSP